ncbi:AP-1 complex subunit mu-2 [Sinocyclocheilus anshuiensis]|uniref:AP-1 complex subunit mu-2-like n=1 Tax=Sinocyclocheilus anshuiensis TaxID=1608454 RepID=A0A671Q0Z8_9TELE|nr:PREDICTED: AP-1 complex subunit mu-2-like [Sinocyclocheilus anshuiensis]
MSASAVFVLDLKGKVLICRNYKGDVDMSEIDHFFTLLMQQEEEGLVCPVMSHGNVHFLWIKHSNLYLVATTNKNSNASLVYAFLYKLVEVFTEYFKELEEESIQDNFVLCRMRVGPANVCVCLCACARVCVHACVCAGDKGKSVAMEDVKFHQCVRLSRFESDRTISFIPPDGESELMSYRINTHVKPLIWIESVIEKFSHSRVEIMVKAKGQFKKQSVANNVEIYVPVPSDADSPKFKTSTGHAKYVPEKNLVVWSIKSFPGGKEFLMRAHFSLPSVENHELEGRPPITVKFEIPYYTVSGIQVRYMKIIEKSGYQALPWVRYITQSGDYQLRTNS